MAANATALAIRGNKRGSIGLGIIYSAPNASLSTPAAFSTSGGTGYLAILRIASTAAIFISSLISLARTSSAPRKINGKHNTLLTWLG